jgi:hypothetical protein
MNCIYVGTRNWFNVHPVNVIYVFDRTKQLVIETNNCLANLALKRNVQFVKTYKQFVKQPGSLYKRKCFCKDGLHASYLGVSVLRNVFIGVVNHVH